MTQDHGASAEPTGLSSASQIEPVPVSPVPASIPSADELRALAEDSLAMVAFSREQVILLANELDRLRSLARANNDLARMYSSQLERQRAALIAVSELIDNSEGVYGLHLNGDPSPWDELRTGGRFEGWLLPFDAASAMSAEGQDPQGLGAQPASAVPQGDAQ